jgi:hypothetical protein
MHEVVNNQARSTRIVGIIETSRLIRARAAALKHAAEQAVARAVAIVADIAERLAAMPDPAMEDPASEARNIAKARSVVVDIDTYRRRKRA